MYDIREYYEGGVKVRACYFDEDGLKVKELFYKNGIIYRVAWYYENGNKNAEQYLYKGHFSMFHRLDGPAGIEYYSNGQICNEKYLVKDYWHRENGPAYIEYNSDGKVVEEEYYVHGILHRLDGPAHVYYDENGNIKRATYWVNGKMYDDMFLYAVAVGSLKEV